MTCRPMSVWSFSFFQVKIAPRANYQPEQRSEFLFANQIQRRCCMRLQKQSKLFCCFALSALFMGGAALGSVPATQGTDKLIYADFETVKDNRPVSSRGGFVQLFGYQENAANPSRFKGTKS